MFVALKPGEVRLFPLGEYGGCCWVGKSEDGSQSIVTGAVYSAGYRQPTEEEIIAAVKQRLAERVAEAAAAPKPSKHPRSSPKALGRVKRTLEAREAVQQLKQPAVVRTRRATCPRCRVKVEVVVAEDTSGRCPQCGCGGL